MIARNASRLEEATLFCEKGVEVTSGSFVAHNSLGAVLMKSGKSRPAIRAFKRAAALNQTTGSTAEYNLALAYISAGERDLAVKTLEGILASDHTHSAARAHLQDLKSQRSSVLS